MKTHLIALTFLGLVAIFLAGCAATTDTTSTTTTTQDTRMQNARIAR